ncbi:MAG: glycogen synthase [Firmicutes bacterium]|nr:glycogen synthase [Bacillota bacterium]
MGKKNLKVLFVSSEVRPYSASGGLGDVAGSLPNALKAQGVDVRVVFPKYGNIPSNHLEGIKYIDSLNIHLGWREQGASIHTIIPKNKDEVQVYLIENDYYFGRDGYYGYSDDYERFAFFSKVSIEFLTKIKFKPDIIHFNDWQTGLGCTYLRDIYRGFVYYKNMKSLFTIHNLRYQGSFGREILWAVGLNDGYFTNGDLEFYGNASLLKAGIIHSDMVSTVSETYTKEIQTPDFGYGMDGLLRMRGEHDKKLFGIVNGIDVANNDPATDKRIFVNFDSTNVMQNKPKNKAQLQELLGLPQKEVPMIGIISRLDIQKGFDIIAVALEEILAKDVQFVILGTGEGRYEELFRTYAHRYPEKLSAQITFNGQLAQRIYASSDIFLMPSIYEPCGLGQMFAMRYGTVPIVRKTGGLADTVTHFGPDNPDGNGFVFEDFVASALMWALNQALAYYDTPHWKLIIQNAMNCDFSWDRSAKDYIQLYNSMLK